MPNRKEPYDLSAILSLYPDLTSSGVEIYIDIENKKESQRIKDFLKIEHNLKKFRRIVYEILKHGYNDDLFQKVKGYQDVAEMRFLGKSFGNARIYCKDIKSNGKKVIMISILNKSQRRIKDDAATKSICERISKYRYDL